MPNPNGFDNQDEWMKVCVPKMVDEGKEQDQAVAACMQMWKDKDGKTIDTLVAYGGAVKALGGGKIGGYLVRFTSDDDPDMDGEYFTKDTDFGEAVTAPVYYQHGQDPKLKRRRLGKASHKVDEFGVWAEAQLNLRDEYEQFIYDMAEKGKMAWSSGTAGHLVEREPKGKATWLKSWPLGLDDTLTPTPAEPRNIAMPLKSWHPAEFHHTLAERIADMTGDMNILTNDVRAFVKGIDRPLSETKRKELSALLESCSGMVAVRDDLQAVLTTAPVPTKLVEAHKIRRQLADLRNRQPYVAE